MKFSEILEWVLEGSRARRTAWPKNAFIFLSCNRGIGFQPYIELRTISGGISYSATSPDLLGIDWEIYE